MIYRRPGRVPRLVARILIVVFSTMSPAIMHSPSAVDECLPASVTHDADAHRFIPAQDERADSGHCWLCHWARAFRSGPASGTLVPRPSFVRGRYSFDRSAWAAHPAWARIPARSPPPLSFV